MGLCGNLKKIAAYSLNLGARFSNVPETFRARKAISKTMKPFMYRAFNVNRFCI